MRLTQAAVARKAGLSVPTVRQLERGRGNLQSWQKALDAIGLELAGRNLPPGPTLGKQIAALRKRKRLSQRKLASIVQITHATVVSLELHGKGRVDVLDRVLTVLGAGAYLAEYGTAKPFFTHAGNSSTDDRWETPQGLLRKLYTVFGTFDLDPCSPTANKRTAPVRARVRYTPDDDGLSLSWFGNVFLNPPYGRQLGDWVAKAHAEAEQGNAQTVIALVPARTDTRYWHEHVAGKAAVFFLRGRLSFGKLKQSAPFPSALVVWGAAKSTLSALQQVLPDAWLS
jgi:phage N-6-adenine-methyltransferase